MSGSAPTNDQAVQFEEQQAAQAQATEAQRQARLTQGTNMINQIFDFSPATPASTSNYDWSTFQAPTTSDASTATGVPTGYTATYQNPTPGHYASGPSAVTQTQPSGDTGGSTGGGYSHEPTAAASMGQQGQGAYTPGTAGGWGLTDASGKFYAQGTPISITTPAQAEGGFGPDFYQNYTNQVLNYYDPQEEKQYAEAQRDLTFNLARAGTLNSTVAADKQGDLAYTDALNKASIVANANQQTGQLQQQIQGNKQSLLNQLYATEDPTETADLAEASAKASQLQDPTLTPAAAFFAPAATAVGGIAQSLTSPYSTLTATGAPIVPSTAVSSASSSSGKTFS